MTGQQSANVLVHPDFLRLEDELAERISVLRTGTPTAPILVVAPSTRQVHRLREVLARKLGAVLGVECVHYQALAFHLQATQPIALSLASTALLETLIRRILLQEPDLPLARYGVDRPAAVRALLRLMTEFREAGLDSSDLTQVDGIDPQLPRILERLDAALTAMEKESSHTDRAGLLRQARRVAPSRKPYLAVFAYGGYELIGANLDLLRSLPVTNPLTYLVPMDAEAPAWEFAQNFVASQLSTSPTVLEDGPSPRSTLSAARGFWNHKATPIPFDPSAIRFVHVQGPEAELTVAARKTLDWIRSGVPPHEIAIISRALEPYAPLAETVFDRHHLVVDTTLAPPASRYPQVRALLLLLQSLGRDFERQPVIELIRSPLLLRPNLSEKNRSLWRPGPWDQWSRAFGIVRGSAAWMEELPGMLETQPPPPWIRPGTPEADEFEVRRAKDSASARVLGSLVGTWKKDREAWHQCGTGAEHAAFLRRLAGRHLHGFQETTSSTPVEESVRSSWFDILDELEGLALVKSLETGNPASLTVSEALEFVERSLDNMTIPESHPQGVRFLDVMQTRGLVFSHVCLIGFHGGLFPRRRREDPFLPDRQRQKLMDKTGKPLGLPSAGRLEERLLLAQTVAAARESLTVVWQSADAEGKSKSVSPYISELCRGLPGAPAVRAVLGDDTPWTPSRVPAHPSRAAAWLEKETGMVTREEGSILIADTAGTESVSRLRTALGKLDSNLVESLDPGLNLVQAVESFDGALDYDGSVAWDEEQREGLPFSASSLKRLGRCPLTYFFRHVLKIQALEDTTREFRLGTKELGTQVHTLLEGIYNDLHGDGLLNGDTDAPTLIDAGKKHLEIHFNRLLDTMGRRLQNRFPLLFEHTRNAWYLELQQFLEKDLLRLATEGHHLESAEVEWQGETTVDLPEGPQTLVLTGIPDRVTRDRDGRWLISDYKTSGKLEKEIEPQEFLRSHRVQLPYYILLAQISGKEGPVAAEALGLGPAFLPDKGFVRTDSITLDPEAFTKMREAFLETLGVLNDIRQKGRFPFRADFGCQWCEFQHACRRNHFPSRERVENHTDNQTYFDVQRKSKTKKLLSQLEGSR